MEYRRKRLALISAQSDEYYQRRFIEGFLGEAFKNDMDVSIFSMYRKYQTTALREQGEGNIFNLLNTSLFDGIVMLKDTLQTKDLAENLEKRIAEEYKGPVITVEKESDFFPSALSNGYDPFCRLTEHFIKVHGFKKLGFLTGKEWHPHSIERLNAFKDTLAKNGLEINEDWIVYGDFWYNSGEKCADKMLSSGSGLPEAVLCANDAMAIGLCSAFEKRGIRVPEDIAVSGYDHTEEGATSPKTITSAEVPAYECGIYCADFIRRKLSGEKTEAFKGSAELRIGESCGCEGTGINQKYLRRSMWDTDISKESFGSVNVLTEEDSLSQTTISGYLDNLYSYFYQLEDAEEFHLCLCEPYLTLSGGEEGEPIPLPQVILNEGYTKNMIHAVSCSADKKGDRADFSVIFPVEEILPGLTDTRPEPAAWFFTPFFFEKQCFGYAVISYGNRARSYDTVYRSWINAMARGFEGLLRHLRIRALEDKIEGIKNSKFDTGNIAYENLNEEQKEDYKIVTDILDNNLFTYHFQPIVRTTDGSIYSYEALMRSTTEKRISPLDIIKYAGMQGRLSDVERYTFLNVLAIVDSSKDQTGMAKVFINSIPGEKLYASDKEKMEKLLSGNSDTVVVELTEESEFSDDDLKGLKDFFGELKIETAVDDYGTGYSNISNLLRYMPNYVKIDRSLLSEIQDKPQKQHFVKEIVEFCHDNNILALAEGIETSEELRTVIHLGVDLIQGYYTAKPGPGFLQQIDKKIQNEIVTYHRELQDGITSNSFIAGRSSRVSLAAMIKDNCMDLIIGRGEMTYKDIQVQGSPSLKTDIHLHIEEGYTGRIGFENVFLSNVKGRPCIEIADNVDVTFILSGENTFNGQGVYVPASSRVVFEGDGNLTIQNDLPEYYGIGAGVNEKHGTIVFDQDGKIKVTTLGGTGCLIGSGMGGSIIIRRGQYELYANGKCCAGIGALYAPVDLSVDSCVIEENITADEAVCIGSVEGDADIEISRSAFRFYGGGTCIVGAGSVSGGRVSVFIKNANGSLNLRGDEATGVGTYKGDTDIEVDHASLDITINGRQALSMGGVEKDTVISFNSSDIRSVVHNSLDKDIYVKDEEIKLVNGRHIFFVNDRQINRDQSFGKYD
ncbi:MAG: EAL domain-containing protein [Lachnospiraceae bacterium]|nr:EAL domain-containing protein [Lachnospiraceae bacterium]